MRDQYLKYFFKLFIKRKILIRFLFILITLNIHTEEIKRVFFTKYLFSGQNFNSSVYNGNLLPDSKIKGIKTYIFTSEIIIPSSFNDIPLAIVMGPAYYCVEVSVNDFNIFYQGSYKSRANSIILNMVSISIDQSIIKKSSNLSLKITIQTENERHPLPVFYLTTYSRAASDTFWHNFFNINLVQAGFIVAIIISLYFMFMFLSHRRFLFLYICCLAFFYALCTVNMTFNYVSSNYILLGKISRTSFPLCLLFVLFFITEYTGILKNQWIKIMDIIFYIPFLIRILISKTQYDINVGFNETIMFYILPNLVITFSIILISVIKNNFKKNIPFLIAFLIIILTSLHDIFYLINFKNPFLYFVNYGYLFLVIIIFYILAGEQSELYKSLLIVKNEVEELNVGLEKKVQERTSELKELSLIDPLTGLRNRRYISEFVSDMVEKFKKNKIITMKNKIDRRDSLIKNKVLGIFLMDIDNFKNINDTYGHGIGDEVLIIFANKLKKLIRSDDIIIRWGGEEFFILLNKTIKQYIPVLCEKILTLFRETKIEIEGSLIISRTCSIGCTFFPLSDQYPESISFEKSISISDMALYMAKENGRDQAIIVKLNKKLLKNKDQKRRLSNIQKKIILKDPIFIKKTLT